jgi:AraC-like DNA-binding protein
MNRHAIVQNLFDALFVSASSVEVTFAECRVWREQEIVTPHSHPDLHQIDLFHGGGSVTLGPRAYRVRGWTLCVAPPGIRHSFTAGSGTRFGNIGIRLRASFPDIGVPEFCLPVPAGERLQELRRNLQRIVEEWQLRRAGGMLLIRAHALATLADSLRLWAEAEDEPAGKSLVRDVCQYLALHYAHELTVEQLARHAGVRPESLCRAFQRTVGVPPRRYLVNLRLQQAQVLLESGTSVTEAALQSGFQSVHYFNRAFRAAMGLSPGRWAVQRQREIKLKRTAVTTKISPTS